MRRRVLVIGGAGFIGSHVAEVLVREGYQVAIVDNFSTGKWENVPQGVRVHEIDICSEELQQVITSERPECVFHHAAQVSVSKSVSDPVNDAHINVRGSINLLEACRKSGVKKLVYASSAAVYGNPMILPVDENHALSPSSPYGASKLATEYYVRIYRELYGLEYTILRYANVYGPRQDPFGEGGVVGIFVNQALSGGVCTVYGDGEQTRDFVYVEDIARANVLAISRGCGMTMNLGSQSETTVNEVLEAVRRTTGCNVRVEHAPARPGEIRRSVLSNHIARQALGWSPTIDLVTGIGRMMANIGPEAMLQEREK